MKTVRYIAKNELYSLYFSPVAWLIMVVFMVLTSIDYLGSLYILVGNFERGGEGLSMIHNLTSMYINGVAGIYRGIVNNLYVFIPLITMGLMSRELNRGTIKLLHSSPIRISEIVIGKFAAMVYFILSLILLVGIIFLCLSFTISNIDWPHVFSAMMGLFFVLCAYAAIGLFFSSLTSYQVVAALITFATFIFLSKLNGFWQDVDIVRNITFYLDFQDKARNFFNGLINVKDFISFFIIIGLFLGFTTIRLKSQTESISTYKKLRRYLILFCSVLIIGYVSSRPQLNLYYDATRDQLNTITPPTKATLDRLNDGELKVTAYGNLLGGHLNAFLPANRYNALERELWAPYVRFKSDISFKYIYYYNLDSTINDDYWTYKRNPGKSLIQIAKDFASAIPTDFERFLPPAEINKLVDVKKQEDRCFFVLEYKGRKAHLQMMDDPNDELPREDEISAAIHRLVDEPLKVIFLTGEIERGPFSQKQRDYHELASGYGNRTSLLNQGYDIDTLSLLTNEIPKDTKALVIADPRTAFNPIVLSKVQKYIDLGGNLLLLTKPDRSDIIQSILSKLGVSLKPGLLVQSNEKYAGDRILTYLSKISQEVSPRLHRKLTEDAIYFRDTTFAVKMGGANAIDYSDSSKFKVHPLLWTDSLNTWNRIAPISTDSLQVKVKKSRGDEHGRFATAILLNRTIKGLEQNIVIASDADFLTQPSLESGRNPKTYNKDIGFSLFSYFSNRQVPANTLHTADIDNKFRITVADIEIQEMLLYYGIPGIIAIIGSILLIRRKRK